ncbi:MAG: FkbM family methyltransferase [Candidatus Micrarchaeaceae archaeon]
MNNKLAVVDDLNDYHIVIETFISEQYIWLKKGLKPHTIAIDIGAHCGDSAVFLAQQPNIDIVLSYDNNSKVYERAKLIIAKCRKEVREKILYLPAKIVENSRELHNPDIYVPRISLSDILSRERKPIIIKCDVEGAEHNIFRNLYAVDFKNVYKIQIEYHHGPQKLPNILKALGFRVKVERPWTITKDLGEVGWIYAER